MSKVLIRIIAVLEIIGGATGPLFVIWALAVSPLDLSTLLISMFPLFIFMFSIAAGVGLWRGTQFGRNMSILIQIIQIPKIISPFVIFVISVGLDLWIHIVVSDVFSNFGFELKLLAFYQLFFATANAPYGLGISLTSCIALVILIRYRPERVATSGEPPSSPPLPTNQWPIPAQPQPESVSTETNTTTSESNGDDRDLPRH